MNRNLVGSIYMYGRLFIKFPRSRMKGERHRWAEPLVLKCGNWYPQMDLFVCSFRFYIVCKWIITKCKLFREDLPQAILVSDWPICLNLLL